MARMVTVPEVACPTMVSDEGLPPKKTGTITPPSRRTGVRILTDHLSPAPDARIVPSTKGKSFKIRRDPNKRLEKIIDRRRAMALQGSFDCHDGQLLRDFYRRFRQILYVEGEIPQVEFLAELKVFCHVVEYCAFY